VANKNKKEKSIINIQTKKQTKKENIKSAEKKYPEQ